VPKIRGDNIADHKRRTVDALHRAGADLFLELGFVAVTLGAIADRAGIGRTTVYEYYRSKEALLADVVHHRVPHLLRSAVEALEHQHPLDRLEELFRACVDHAVIDRDATHLLFRVARELPPDHRDEVWRSFDPVIGEIRRIVHDGVAHGELRGHDPDIIEQIVVDHLVATIETIHDAKPGDLRRRELVDERLEFLRAGLAT
jgi:AcrR family transcriptional regulator